MTDSKKANWIKRKYSIKMNISLDEFDNIKLLNKIGFQNINFKEKFFPNSVNFYSLKDKSKISGVPLDILKKVEKK